MKLKRAKLDLPPEWRWWKDWEIVGAAILAAIVVVGVLATA